jgi:hypothetical protein
MIYTSKGIMINVQALLSAISIHIFQLSTYFVLTKKQMFHLGSLRKIFKFAHSY